MRAAAASAGLVRERDSWNTCSALLSRAACVFFGSVVRGRACAKIELRRCLMQARAHKHRRQCAPGTQVKYGSPSCARVSPGRRYARGSFRCPLYYHGGTRYSRTGTRRSRSGACTQSKDAARGRGRGINSSGAMQAGPLMSQMMTRSDRALVPVRGR